MIMLLVLFSIFVYRLWFIRVRTSQNLFYRWSSRPVFRPTSGNPLFESVKIENIQLAVGHVVVELHRPCRSSPEFLVSGSSQESSDERESTLVELSNGHQVNSRPARARRQGPVLTMALESANL